MVSEASERRFVLKSEEVAWRVVGNELIVLEFSSSTYLTLNGTAKDLWESIADGATISSLADMLESRYNVSNELARSDAELFINALIDRGIAQVAP
jgi:Coenzyme PQQ synthesis protein D (PqqD)